jgi:hypothetical protein
MSHEPRKRGRPRLPTPARASVVRPCKLDADTDDQLCLLSVHTDRSIHALMRLADTRLLQDVQQRGIQSIPFHQF